MKYMSIDTKKLDRETTLKAIDYLTKRLNFNNDLNKFARGFMKARGLDTYGAFNGFHDSPTEEMMVALKGQLETQDWMTEHDKVNYLSSCSAIFGQVYSPATNQYVRDRIKRYQAHLEEIELSAGAREEHYEDFTVYRDLSNNRMKLVFEYVPDAGVRTALKQLGFRWSPYMQAWTRTLSANAEKSLSKFKEAVGVK